MLNTRKRHTPDDDSRAARPQKKKAKTRGNTEGNGKGGKDKGITIGEERTGFDYKRDMVDFRSSMQGSAAQKMVDEAKQLDSRFTKRILKK